MLMAYIWLLAVCVSILYGSATGNAAALSTAALEGAGDAVELCISIAGALCLWSGVLELMSRSGLSEALSRALRPLLRRIYPVSFSDTACAQAISENFSANLLGLGNAATPAGIRAAQRMSALGAPAERETSRLVLMNTASIQLIPATVAAVRAASGCDTPFDILPCVWLSSAAALCAGALCSIILERRIK